MQTIVDTELTTKAESILFNWDVLCNCIVRTFRLTNTEADELKKNKVAQIIAAIPFAAQCEEPDRTALAHLSIYMTELKGGSKIGGHNKNDNENLYTRLRLLSSFKGGEQDIISHGLDILAYIMVQGYFHSKESDKILNIYNPLNDNSWDYESISQELLDKIHSQKCEILDELFMPPEPFITW